MPAEALGIARLGGYGDGGGERIEQQVSDVGGMEAYPAILRGKGEPYRGVSGVTGVPNGMGYSECRTWRAPCVKSYSSSSQPL